MRKRRGKKKEREWLTREIKTRLAPKSKMKERKNGRGTQQDVDCGKPRGNTQIVMMITMMAVAVHALFPFLPP